LFNHPELLHKKICEEARELVEAVDPQQVVNECADLVYFASIQLLRHSVTWDQVEQELARRLGRVTRRVEKAEDRQVLERGILPQGIDRVPPTKRSVDGSDCESQGDKR
jgi:phosphoribosyl-ATP pyrophosphohydrolase